MELLDKFTFVDEIVEIVSLFILDYDFLPFFLLQSHTSERIVSDVINPYVPNVAKMPDIYPANPWTDQVTNLGSFSFSGSAMAGRPSVRLVAQPLTTLPTLFSTNFQPK